MSDINQAHELVRDVLREADMAAVPWLLAVPCDVCDGTGLPDTAETDEILCTACVDGRRLVASDELTERYGEWRCNRWGDSSWHCTPEGRSDRDASTQSVHSSCGWFVEFPVEGTD